MHFFCPTTTIYFLPSDIHFCTPWSYLELLLSKGSCSTILLKTAYVFLPATTEISLCPQIPFTLDWNLQFPFKCSSTFALAIKSQKNVGWLGPLDVIEYNTHCLQPGPVPGLFPTSKLEQAAQGHILLSFEYLQGLRYPSLHGTFFNVSPPSQRKYFSQ